jgi:hypothetical protein
MTIFPATFCGAVRRTGKVVIRRVRVVAEHWMQAEGLVVVAFFIMERVG